MKCWYCGQDSMQLGEDGVYRCLCGATGESDNAVQRKPRVRLSPNGSLHLNVVAELRKRLESVAKSRAMSIEEYTLTLLNREVGRTHHKKKVRRTSNA